MALNDEQRARVKAVQGTLAIEGHVVSDERARVVAERYFASGREEKIASLPIDPDAMNYDDLVAALQRAGLED